MSQAHADQPKAFHLPRPQMEKQHSLGRLRDLFQPTYLCLQLRIPMRKSDAQRITKLQRQLDKKTMWGRALPSHLPSLSASQLRKQSGYKRHRLTGRFHSFIWKVWGSKSNSLLCFTDNVIVFADSCIPFFAPATFFPPEHFPTLYPVMFLIA